MFLLRPRLHEQEKDPDFSGLGYLTNQWRA